jgi:hypothetical protein
MPKQDFEPGANPALSKTKPKAKVKKVDTAKDRLERARLKELKRPKKLWEIEPALYDALLTGTQDKKAEEDLKLRVRDLEIRDLREMYGVLPSADSPEELSAAAGAQLYRTDAEGNVVVDLGGLEQFDALTKFNRAKAQLLTDEKKESIREALRAKVALDQERLMREQKAAESLAARNAALAVRGARAGAAEQLEEIRQRFAGQADEARVEMERKRKESDERIKNSYAAGRKGYLDSLFFGDR